MHKFLTLCLFLLILIGYVSTAVGGILFYEDCEDAIDSSDWQFQDQGTNNKFTVSSEHPFAGSKSWQFYNNGTGSPARLEVALVTHAITGRSYHFEYNKTYWIGYAIYLPSSNNGQPATLGQFHGVPDAPVGNIRGVSCDHYRAGTLSMPKISTIDPATTNMRIMSQSDFCGNGPDGKADFTRQSFPTSTVGYLEDQWNTVVVKVRFNFTTGGEIKIWMNGDLAFEDNDVVGYNDAKGPYFKIGVYATTKPVTAFYDEIRVGDANSSYDEVCPKGPKTISLNAPLLKIVN